MTRFLGKFRKNFKINFGPQHPTLGYLDNVRTSGILLLVSDQEVMPPRDMALGCFFLILAMILIFSYPIKDKCLIPVCRKKKRDANSDPLRVTVVLRTKEGVYVAINVVSKTFLLFQSLSLVDPNVRVIQTRLTVQQVIVGLMLCGYWGHLETQILYTEAKNEFLKEATQQFIIELTNAPKFQRNLINSGFCASCYNKFANIFLSEHITLLQKYRC